MFHASGSFVVKILDPVSQPQSIVSFSYLDFLNLFLLIAGFINLIAAQITLGKYYSSTLLIRSDQQLITHRIFRFILNPMYLGLICVTFGIPGFSSSLPGLLIMSALIPVR